ncbi:MAG: hypothetical protein WBM03_14030, partial [Steroidobacteraceae bacterium]
MHFLLIPYALLSAIFVIHFQTRNQKGSRTGLAVISFAIGAMLFAAMLLRPAVGDSWRYYQYFVVQSRLSLGDAFHEGAFEPLFILLNWIAAQFGSSEWILFG